MPEPIAKPTAIQWPQITVGGRQFSLRYAYSSNYKLTRWGKTLETADSIELAAAMAGSFDAQGSWRSADFERAIDLADLLLPDEEVGLIEGVAEAIKKAYPGLTVISQPQPDPGATKPGNSATKNECSGSGVSQFPEAVSA